MIVEGVINRAGYLRSDMLLAGSFRLQGENLPRQYAKLSGKVTDTELDSTNGCRLAYEREMLDVAKRGTYCGMWQLHIIANILQRSVNSWFPDVEVDGFELDHHILNRIIEPFHVASHEEALNIMWTKSADESAGFQHFVPVVQ